MRKRRKVKIAVLLPSLKLGGAERLVVEELSVLNDDPRFDIELHLVFEKGLFYETAAANGIRMRVWNAPHKSFRMLGTYLNIIRYLRKNRIDILHSHLLDGIGPLAGKLAGARVVSTAHSDKKYRAVERYVLAKSDLVLGCGIQVKRNISGFVPANRVNVLSNGIRPPCSQKSVRSAILKRYGIHEGANLVLTLGRLHRLKGFDVLIEAISDVLKEAPGTVFLIGGEGAEIDRLHELIHAYGFKANARMPGIISDTDAVLFACDVYVNSSRWEGLPMTLLEAMAHGRPIVATDVGGNPEVIRDGQTGLLVPPDNPAALAEAILKLLQDTSFGTRLGRQAKDLFEREYTIQRHCEKLADYYLRLLNG